VIHVLDLVKTFDDVTAVDGISFDVRAGEIFAFLGPNGAGKTTTIQMVTTLLRPTRGTIAIDGVDPVAKPHEVRRRFGIVFQDPSLDGDLTAYENMDLHGVLYRVPRRARAERIQSLLALFELWDRRDSRVKTFSGGMKRRLEIARGMLHAEDSVLGRADARPRPAKPKSTLVTRPASKRDGRPDGVSDHALHGRSGARGPPHRHHRPRPHRGAKHAARTETANRGRFARTRFSRPHRLVDPRRAGQRRRPDAPDGEDVD
jgi:ABC-type lipoprotein export system ATPase subunit